MPVFTYTAKDQMGRISTGSLEADTVSGAVSQLREQGLWVTDLKSSGGPRRPPAPRPEKPADAAGVETSVAKQLLKPVSLKDLALFYRQLHTLVNAGVPLYGSLDTLASGAQTPNMELRRVARSLAENILTGGNLSGGMARFPWLFDKMQTRLIEAGEAGGLLLAILDRLAIYLEREYELRMEVKKRTLYPKLLLLSFLFIPPVPILVLRGFIPYVMAVWGNIWWAVIFGVPIYLLWRLAMTTPSGRNIWDEVKLATPVIGPLIRKLAVARFCRSMAALYGAGVPITQSVGLSGEACGNYTLETASANAVEKLSRGASIAQTLEATRFFQPMIIGMIGTGETTGNLDGMLDKAADFYEHEAMHATIQLVVVLGVVLFLIMAVLIGIQVVGFYSGYAGGVNAGGGAAGD